jgi:hypothetical protein
MLIQIAIGNSLADLYVCRDDPLENMTKRFNAINEPELLLLCPVKTVLTIALRLGNVAGARTAQEAISQAAKRKDKTVIWKHPLRPVLPAIAKGGGYLIPDKNALSHQIQHFLDLAADLAGVASRVLPHDLRRGAAKDLARSGFQGFAENVNAVRSLLGHTYRSMHEGTTQYYMGCAEDDLWKARFAKGHTKDPYSTPLVIPATATEEEGLEQKRRQVTTAEVDNYCAEYDLDPASKQDRAKATRRGKQAGRIARIAEQKDAVELPEEDIASGELGEHEEEEGVPGFASAAVMRAIGISDDGEEADDDDENDDAPNMALDALLDDMSSGAAKPQLSSQPSQPGEPSSAQLIRLSPMEFVNHFSTVNTTKNQKFMTVSSEARPEVMARMNASMFQLYCRFREAHKCNYSTGNRHNLDIHHTRCKPVKEKPAAKAKPTGVTTSKAKPTEPEKKQFQKSTTLSTLQCSRCPKKLSNKQNLARHELEHDWVAKPCSHGCEPGKLYQNRAAYEKHAKSKHADSYSPTHCPIKTCKSARKFKSLVVLQDHFGKAHPDLQEDEVQKLIDGTQEVVEDSDG